MTQIAVRLPDLLVSEMDEAAQRSNATRSQIVRLAVESYLYRLACERDAAAYEGRPLTEAELALADDADGWVATPAW